MVRTERWYSVSRLILLSGLFAACLSACGGAKGIRVRGEPEDSALRLLIDSCRVMEKEQENKEVACPLGPFKIGLHGYANTLENLAACQADVDEVVQLCGIDKAEMQGKVNALQEELARWYRNPWLMGLLGAAAGAAVVTGVMLSR